MKKKKSGIDIFLQLATWGLLIASFAIVIVSMKILSEEVPVHFDIHGNPDRYGPPGSMLVFPLVMVFAVGISQLVAHLDPEVWNIPFKVQEQKKERVYTLVRRMLYLINLEIGLFTVYMSSQSILLQDPPMIGVFIFLGAIVVTIIVCLMLAKKANETE